jgi:hypothetical protein
MLQQDRIQIVNLDANEESREAAARRLLSF